MDLRTATIIGQLVKILYCAIVHTITLPILALSIVKTKGQNSPKNLMNLSALAREKSFWKRL